VQLVFETAKPIAEVARELGVNEGTLGNWCAIERRWPCQPNLAPRPAKGGQFWPGVDNDPAFLVVAWGRVRSNKGARTAGVDGIAPRDVDAETVRDMLDEVGEDLKAHRFVPQMVREKTIPKSSGKIRRLGIATTRDRIVQAALKLVLEPIFEADFKPCSYGFRLKRRAQTNGS